MSILTPVWDTPPDFVNERGVKWWKDVDTTEWATRKDQYGTTLDAAVFFVEEANGTRSRVMIQDGAVTAVEQSLEAMAVKIDALKFLMRDAQKEELTQTSPRNVPIAIGTSVRYTSKWLALQSKEEQKRYRDRTGTVSGYRMGAKHPVVTFPKTGRLKEQKHFEASPQDLEIVP